MSPIKQLLIQFLKSQHILSITGADQEAVELFLSSIAPELKEDAVFFSHSDHDGENFVELKRSVREAISSAELSGTRVVFAAPVNIPVYVHEASCVIEVTQTDLGDALFNLGTVAFTVSFTKCRGYTFNPRELVLVTQK